MDSTTPLSSPPPFAPIAHRSLASLADATTHADLRVCPGCPAVVAGVLPQLLPLPGGSCAFRCESLEARAALPRYWAREHALVMVRRGILVRQREERGGTIAIDAVGPGGAFVLTPPATPHDGTGSTGFAASDAAVCLCPADVVRDALARDTAAARDFIRLQASALDRVERIAAARGRAKVGARVAALLCALADTLSVGSDGLRIPADLQQRDLAALVSVRPESVCRVLGQLVRRGVVGRDGRGLRILDRARLEALA